MWKQCKQCFPVVMYGCESWTIKLNTEKLLLWTVVLERTLESPFDCKEMKLVNPKKNQSRIFIGKTDAEAEAPILWPPYAKNWFTGKDPDGGKDWRWEMWTTEDEMVGWHHWLNGYEFEQALEDGEVQGSLGYYDPWGCKESDTTERLNNNKKEQRKGLRTYLKTQ